MKRLLAYFSFLVLLAAGCSDEVRRAVNPDTGLPKWIIESGGVHIELVPVTREYIKAVFSSRGLPRPVIEKVGEYCMFGTIIRNGSAGTLSNRLAEWRYVTPDGEKHPPKTKSEWVSGWQEQGLAFRWLLMAEDQVYAPEDWGQGFTTVKLPPESEFDLEYVWDLDGKRHTGTIRGMQCAPQEISNE